jgi:ABC-2 type transport system ATP-binding protein
VNLPLFFAEDARIAVDGVIAIERLTSTSGGDRLLFAGDTSALFAALTNVALGLRGAAANAWGGEDAPPLAEAAVVGGVLRVAGRDVADASHLRVAGAAPLDPPLPPSYTAAEYVGWGARLAGASKGQAKDLAANALAKTGLARIQRRALGALDVAERRAVVIAQAIVMSPDVVIAEAPLAGLDGARAAFVLEAVAAATAGRGAILSTTRLDLASPEGALARGASHVTVLAGGEIAFDGAPRELFSGARQVLVVVPENAQALKAELAGRGIDLRGGPARFSAALPAGATTRDLFLAARAVDAPIIELVPLVG